MINSMQNVFKGGALHTTNAANASIQLRNFYLDKRPTIDPKEIRPYPMVQDGELFIVFALNNAASRNATRKIIVSGVEWDQSDGHFIRFFDDKAHAKDEILRLHKNGLKFSNLATMKKQWAGIKLVKTSAKKEPIEPVAKITPKPVKKIEVKQLKKNAAPVPVAKPTKKAPIAIKPIKKVSSPKVKQKVKAMLLGRKFKATEVTA